MPYKGNTHRGRKFTALMILRRWPQEQCWRFLIESLRYIRMYRVGSVAEDGDRITPEMLAMRMLGRAGEIPTFLAGVSEWGERKCRTWLDLSRLKLREIVCGDPSRPEEAGTSGQEQANLKRTLRSKTALMESLALDRQRLERSRRARVQALQHQVAEARREFAAAIREREAWLAELARVTRRPLPPA